MTCMRENGAANIASHPYPGHTSAVERFRLCIRLLSTTIHITYGTL